MVPNLSVGYADDGIRNYATMESAPPALVADPMPPLGVPDAATDCGRVAGIDPLEAPLYRSIDAVDYLSA